MALLLKHQRMECARFGDNLAMPLGQTGSIQLPELYYNEDILLRDRRKRGERVTEFRADSNVFPIVWSWVPIRVRSVRFSDAEARTIRGLADGAPLTSQGNSPGKFKSG